MASDGIHKKTTRTRSWASRTVQCVPMRPHTKLKTTTTPYHRQNHTHTTNTTVSTVTDSDIRNRTASRRPTAPRARARSVSIRRSERREWCVRATLDARDANDSIGLARPRARVVVGRRRSSATRTRWRSPWGFRDRAREDGRRPTTRARGDDKRTRDAETMDGYRRRRWVRARWRRGTSARATGRGWRDG